MSRPALVLIMAFSLLLTLFPILSPDSSSYTFGGGSGTADDPYIIEDVWDLQNISLDLDAYYELGDDINASVTRTWKSGPGNRSGFVPIGEFKGSLHGRGFNITGLFINRSATSFVGLFGSLGGNGFVKDLHLEDIDIRGEYSVGGLAGLNRGAVSDCVVQGSVIGRMMVGGIVGENRQKLSNCVFNGKVVGVDMVGGIVGYLGDYRAFVEECHSIANVTGRDRVGGIVGEGWAVRLCYFNGSVNGTTNVGGIVGVGLISNSHYNVDDVSINGGHYLTLGGMFKDQYSDWISHDLSLDIVDYNSSIVPCEGYYRISDVQGIKDLIGFSDLKGVRVRLTSDIDLTNNPDLFIPMFSGAEIDGDNHTITDLNINTSFSSFIGLIGYCNGGIINNINLVNASINGCSYLGVIAGWIYGRISNCTASGTVNGDNYIGGLVGFLAGYYLNNPIHLTASIDNCSCDVDVVGGESVGGCGGYLSGDVRNCYSHGDVSGDTMVGGFVGRKFYGMMRYCYSTGRVQGEPPSIGGFFGIWSSGWIYDCFFDNFTSGKNASYNPKGVNTTVMKTRSTFANAGWDFNKTWAIVEGKTYPFFRKFDRIPPIAIAGSDQSVDEDKVITFNGSRSSDDIGIDRYIWSFDDNGPVDISGVTASYVFDDPGLFIVTLNVTDVSGHFHTDSLNVTVNDVTPPECDAGPDMIVDEDRPVTFNGSGSTDNVEVENYTWIFDDDGSWTMSGPDPIHTFYDPGIFTISLNVTDVNGYWSTDTINVTVCDITPPIANAGPDRTIVEDGAVTFDGSLSADNVGILSFTWTFVDGDIVVLHGLMPSYQFYDSGSFIVTLNVSDEAGRSSTDEMLVIVIDDDSPFADAGPDMAVDEGSIAVFNGSMSTDDVGIVHYSWTFLDRGPWNLFGAVAVHVFEDPGLYTVFLNVTDHEGQSSVDSLTVFVNDITPPTADAGTDRSITEGHLVEFLGLESTDNVGIDSYTWKFSDVHQVVLIGSIAAYIFQEPGVFAVILRVTDAAGNSDEDKLFVTVIDTTPPVADAGSDRFVPMGSTVILNGSLSTDNGELGMFSWSVRYGGSDQNIEGMVASFEFLLAGSYDVTLKVADKAGNIDIDNIRIVVIGTGKITGFVLDAGGNAVLGAKIEVWAAGKLYTVTTSSNGSFILELPSGPVDWTISKSGYGSISGKAEVKPMETTMIDPDPLVRDKGSESPVGTIIITLIFLLALGFVIFLVLRKKKIRDYYDAIME
jgi:PKD repeat protein